MFEIVNTRILGDGFCIIIDMGFNGLSADEVLLSRSVNGANSLVKKKKKSLVKSFFANFADPILKVLLIALGIQIVFVFNSGEWLETFGIAIALLVAVTVATISEYGSEKAFERLQEQASATDCRVRREGKVYVIPVSEVVVGDLVLLGSGEKVPADGYLISGEIEVDQSLLNGESKEAKKFAASTVAEQGEKVDYLDKASVFSGTVVTNGEAVMLVTAVGGKTEYGKIAAELQEEMPTSPLKVKLMGLAKLISIVGYVGAGLVAVAYFFNLLLVQNNFDLSLAGEQLRDFPFMFMHILRAATLVVSVIVMAVPEGLPMMITVVLSTNMKHMLRDNVLVRKLNGIETAGSMNILFTDKTGTLTNGKLEVVGIVTGDGSFQDVSKFDRSCKLASHIGTVLRFNSQCEMSNGRAVGGNSTDRILREFSESLKCPEILKKISQVPFNSTSKFMSTTLSDGRVLLKGAQEVLLPKLNKSFKKDGSISSSFGKAKIEKQIDELSKKAFRLIAVAIDDVFVCLLAIRDQVRPESVIAVNRLRSAGIQTVMITGDAKATATAIAREVNILEDDEVGLVLTNDELEKLSDEQVASILPNLRVVARALPSDKSRLVRIAQSLNLVVGMTGDGVNDAPALKKADIGFAMGSGTEVAKEAGDIVIMDDNIDSISKGVSYGRTIFKSIRKFLIFKLTINFCAIVVSIVAPLLNVDTPITVIQMLWINLIMDTLAGLAFGGEKPQAKYMTEPPKRRDEPIINRYMWTQILLTGFFTSLVSVLFLISPMMVNLVDERGPIYARSAFFAFFMMLNIFNSFNARSHDLNLFSHIRKNKPFIWIMGVVTVVQIGMVYLGGNIFRTMPLDFVHLLIIILMAFMVVPYDLVRKLFMRGKVNVTT
ncbi:MAG: calcium-translocating P-type ATPase, PMCA-type [Firmicutes bacterium]|nr:calcium-translocating P-type ATPase, PMCA-type [Bacillota bacterium]